MTATLTASDLRRWAMRCGSEAADAASDDDRMRLLKMRDALIQLAENEDWLNGKSFSRSNAQSAADADVIALAERITGVRKIAN